ncbi:MAG: VOC family protein [Armatimonadetes bacterium]|nr:VOC family protein [Armatimonadota bacterium]
MELGAFSVSLAVKDLEASRAFYEKLGFEAFFGEAAQNWLILKNGNCVIGLFQGMFEKNILTFNPGWDGNAQELPEFTDVRELQRQLKARGVALLQEADETTTGPASLFVVDPDGNRRDQAAAWSRQGGRRQGVAGDRRARRDRHALDENGMVLCNPRDREAAHRADVEGIATYDRAAVTCRKCLALLYERDRARRQAP